MLYMLQEAKVFSGNYVVSNNPEIDLRDRKMFRILTNLVRS